MLFVLLLSFSIPTLITLVITIVHNSTEKKSRRNNKTKIVVYQSETYAHVLLASSVFFLIFMLMAPLMWKDEAPNPIENKSDVIFYLVFGGFVLIGLIASIKVLRFKLIFQTNKKIITVHPVILKQFSFNVDDICCIKKQTKHRYQMPDAERIVIKIKTKPSKRVIIDSSYVSYQKFVEKLVSVADESTLIGFKKQSWDGSLIDKNEHKRTQGDGSVCSVD